MSAPTPSRKATHMERIHFSFNEAKATQVAALIIQKSGGVSDHYLLAKCFYDLDREALSQWGQPIIGGDYKLFEFGPLIYQHWCLSRPGVKSYYSDHIKRSENQIQVERDPGVDELSPVEMELAAQVAGRWMNLSFNQANAKIHALPECSDPNVDGDNIPVEVILKSCGKPKEFIDAVAEDAQASKALKSTFGL